MKSRAVAVIWDIEDVTPSISSTFVKGLRDFIGLDGRLSIARVYGDFSKKRFAAAAPELHRESFEMVHLPEEKGDDTAVIISARTMDALSRHSHIDRLILISGRGELRPLLRQVRAMDLETMVVCDARRADERLLRMADSFCDFRDLTIVPMEEERSTGAGTGTDEAEKISFDYSLVLLQEAVAWIADSGESPTSDMVKVRLKLMNEGFDERLLGFDSWNGYLTEAQKRGAVHARFRNNELILTTAEKEVPELIVAFLKALERCSTIHTSEGMKARLPDIGKALEEAGVDYRSYGYSRLKKLADAAAKRGLVLVSLKESSYFLDLTRKGSDLLVRR
jgi:hypothetical protein